VYIRAPLWYSLLIGKEPKATKELVIIGYTTEFEGRIDLDRELTETEIEVIKAFSEERHGGDMNVDPGMPGFWCDWVPTKDGCGIEWNGGEKFYNAAEWMQLIIDRFIEPWGMIANGVINAMGESNGDIWRLHVEDNQVRVSQAVISWGDR
jgi:hypothetical protein